jgi:hypothetical protein
MEAKTCAGSGEVGAGVSPFLKPLRDPYHGWSKPPDLWLLAISLRTLGFDFDALLLIMSQRQLIEQPARSEPAHFQGPIPLLPSPRVLGQLE